MTAITITDAGRRLYRDSTQNQNKSFITYVALGTSSTTPTIADTLLGAEVFRKKVTSYTNGASPGEVLVNMYLSPNDGNGYDIEEVGFFGGTSAGPGANTGILVAHGLFTHNPKVITESIQFQLDLIFS